MGILRTICALLLTTAFFELCLSDQQGATNSSDIKDSCARPNGRGLRNFINQALALISKDDIKRILEMYKDDTEVIALKKLFMSEKLKNTVELMLSSKEYQTLKEFICKHLYMDVSIYRRLLKWFGKDFINTRTSVYEHKGINGLVRDIVEALPLAKFNELYSNLYNNDQAFRDDLDMLKSPKLHELVMELRNTEVYKDLMQQLKEVGVPLNDWYFLQSNFLEGIHESLY